MVEDSHFGILIILWGVRTASSINVMQRQMEEEASISHLITIQVLIRFGFAFLKIMLQLLEEMFVCALVLPINRIHFCTASHKQRMIGYMTGLTAEI